MEKRKVIGKILWIMAAAGVCVGVLMIIMNQVIHRLGYQFCWSVVNIALKAGIFYTILIMSGAVWSMHFGSSDMERMSFIKSLTMVGTITMIGLILVFTNPLTYGAAVSIGFLEREEKTVNINGTEYVARLEYTGFDITGISYHKKLNFALYESEGWQTEYDYDSWHGENLAIPAAMLEYSQETAF